MNVPAKDTRRRDRDTPAYLHGHHEVVVASHARRTADEAAAFVRDRISAGMRILDLGCGPGSITVGLAEWVGPDGEVVGVDASHDVLVGALADREASLGLLVADAFRLPFQDATFDVVYAHQLLQHVADPVAVLTEARRVLRSGGLIAARDADYGTMLHHPRHPQIDRWLELYHAVATAVGGNPDAGRRLPEWVEAAGFTLPTFTTTTWTFADADTRRSWAELWAERVLRSDFADHAIDRDLTSRAELEEIAGGWRRWASESAGVFVFVHGEIVATRP